jgi:hypothetical protein
MLKHLLCVPADSDEAGHAFQHGHGEEKAIELNQVLNRGRGEGSHNATLQYSLDFLQYAQGNRP